MQMEEGYLNLGGKKIWYCVYGKDKANTPMLVVHGGPGFSSFTDVFCEFRDERPVYFYDQLGCGKSDLAENPDQYSVEAYVQELENVLKELKLSEVILLGHSWGGALVCSYMLEKNPEGIKSLILASPYLSTPYFFRDAQENLSRLPESVISTIEKCEKNNDYGEEYMGATIEYYKRFMCILEPFPMSLIEAFNKMNQDIYFTLWGPSEFSITGTLKDFDLYPELNKITVPVLLICGDRDEVGVKTMKDYQMAFPTAQLAVIPNASHMNVIERPDIFKAVINEFIKDK